MVGKPERQVAVFGAGYIGLVTGACLAELGHRVVVRDIDPDKVALLRSGDVPIYEPGLGDMIVRNKERLTFTLDLAEALDGAEIAYVCVDTPPSASGDADLSRIWAVVKSLEGATHLKAVVVKSTVPVGTGARVRSALDAAGLAHVGYAANPEFTAEGRAVADFMQPDRIVIGAADEATAQLIADLHDGVDGPVAVMDVRSAEMVKLASNALLATKISFINEIATLCEKTGADVEEVARAVGLDHRLGPHFLRPGIGWGGSCFPKDSEALRQLASNTGYHLQLLSAVIEVNNLQKRRAIQKLKDELGTLAGMRVALLGLTFKPGTDDMREATSTVLASRLLAEGAEVRCWDPMARPGEVEPWISTTRHATPEEAMEGADAVILVTEWPQLKEVDWAQAASAMRRPVLFDGRNLLDPAAMRALGYTYMSVGRP
ncbi:UDP-glucose dehydrogenase family protein [Nonomuraea gerenzanensis]|uniref:UDP-glucose 6-dehydrogenase n=1 Tax=Nonomuraea gerenzanensis TaxID=93944 RepID=A0A1M4E953_9ACTN|nr:UDP-glucose/GDP-mannose dehydrogenase family protein [Nonomuraea gerenzanensis]UBU17599.1 UDP-glucose/GDP-mannose dehydrogenase family protein [Nonomuraea gerenzanensis]SBO95365.1 UDP-glucose dehydrogenase [Nonomuraea gerenzanensis]